MKVMLVKTTMKVLQQVGKSCREFLESVRDIEHFFLQRGKFTLANEFSLLADKVSENAVSERSHQSTLERYFITE